MYVNIFMMLISVATVHIGILKFHYGYVDKRSRIKTGIVMPTGIPQKSSSHSLSKYLCRVLSHEALCHSGNSISHDACSRVNSLQELARLLLCHPSRGLRRSRRRWQVLHMQINNKNHKCKTSLAVSPRNRVTPSFCLQQMPSLFQCVSTLTACRIRPKMRPRATSSI